MARRASLRALSSALLVALFISALWPQPAFAGDDAPPPAEPSPTETAPPSDAASPPNTAEAPAPPEPAAPAAAEPPPASEPVVTDAPAAAESLPASEPVVADAPVAVPSIVEEPAASSTDPDPIASAGDLLADLPDDTTVVVLDEAGDALPLASAEAAEIVATGDPVWCPAGALPTAATCSASFANLAALVAGFVPTGNGVIWIEKGADSSAGPIEIDGSSGTWSSARTYSLTFQGGWNGPGTTTVDTTDPSQLHVLDIENWEGDITLNDLVFSGVPGPWVPLHIASSKKVTLNRVEVTTNALGARIDNRAGASDVVVNASEFSGITSTDGLWVTSNGAITLAGVLARNNHGAGARLDNSTAATAKNVTLTSGTFEFAGNGDTGLIISSLGSIALKDITATGNTGAGVDLDNSGGTGKVTLTGVNLFAQNGFDGLVVESRGAIAASNLVGDLNGYCGASLDNEAAATAQPVTLTGTNEFKFNGCGLDIESNGLVSVSNLTGSNSSYGRGVEISNDNTGFSSDVKVTGYLIATANYTEGLQIGSHGAITLANVTASGNSTGPTAYDGASLYNDYLTTPRPITLSGVNTFTGNAGRGLSLASLGAVSVSNLTASGNGGSGAEIQNNALGPALPQAVTLIGSATFANNAGEGLLLDTYGAVKIANLTARENGASGARITDWFIDSTKVASVSLTGVTSMVDNGVDGLFITSLGSIAVSNLLSETNGGTGAILNNNHPGAKAGVTISGTSGFNGNGSAGLTATSRGAITLQDVVASTNGGVGINLSNSSAGSVGNVVVGTSRAAWCNTLTGNTSSGMTIASLGAVTLSNVCAEDNGGNGVSVDNGTAGSPKAVALNGTNQFTGNGLIGLDVTTKGAVTLGSVVADDNSSDGILIDNTAAGPALPQNVTVTGSARMNTNARNGLSIQTYGSITLGSLLANENGTGMAVGTGVLLDNSISGTAASARAVTLKGAGTFNDNFEGGLSILSTGAIKAGNLSASGNGGSGVALSTQTGLPASSGITLSGVNVFGSNDGDGLAVSSSGAANLMNVIANGNDGQGATILAVGPTAPQMIRLTGVNAFFENGGNGLEAWADGQILLSNVTAIGNTAAGAVLDNAYFAKGTPAAITLSGLNTFSANGEDGLDIEATGSVTLNNITADVNGDQGIAAESPGSITLSCASVVGNNGSGYWLDSVVSILLKGAHSFGNGAADHAGAPLVMYVRSCP